MHGYRSTNSGCDILYSKKSTRLPRYRPCPPERAARHSVSRQSPWLPCWWQMTAYILSIYWQLSAAFASKSGETAWGAAVSSASRLPLPLNKNAHARAHIHTRWCTWYALLLTFLVQVKKGHPHVTDVMKCVYSQRVIRWGFPVSTLSVMMLSRQSGDGGAVYDVTGWSLIPSHHHGNSCPLAAVWREMRRERSLRCARVIPKAPQSPTWRRWCAGRRCPPSPGGAHPRTTWFPCWHLSSTSTWARTHAQSRTHVHMSNNKQQAAVLQAPCEPGWS